MQLSIRWRRANADEYVFAALKAKDLATLLHIHTLELYKIKMKYKAEYCICKSLSY
jgi:hypothetical protein